MLTIKQLPINSAHVSGPLILLILTIFAYLFNDNLSQYLVYHRTAISEFEFWRLFTGHIFHTNDAHLLLNTLAVILLWAIHGHYYSPKQYLMLFLFSTLVISGGIFVFEPEMEQYVGLSGVLHAFFVWGACKDIAVKEKTGYLLLIGALIKIANEQLFGASAEIADLINANVAINAHLFGAIAGVIYYYLAVVFSKTAK